MRTGLLPLALAVVLAAPGEAFGQDKPIEQPPILGLPPDAPQSGPVPGGVAPAYHRAMQDRNDWRFDFHGMLMVPLRASIGKREVVEEDQSEMTLHAPPLVPDYQDSFNYTGTVPQTYVKLLFSYGNPVVTGNISIVSEQPRMGASYFDPPLNPGIEDAYLNFNLRDLMKNARFDVNVGAFSNRYGIMGEWDEGRYATPLIARTNGIGETISAGFAFGDFALMLEQGFQGQADKPWNGITPDYSNDFADPKTGAGWVSHIHAGLGYKGLATLGLHYLTVFSADDRAIPASEPDGRMDILGADLRLTLGRFGHFYFGTAHHDVDHGRSLGRIVEVLNVDSGVGLNREYFGPDEQSESTGKLLTFGFQYDLSVSRLLWYPVPFVGEGPDIVVSVFGMQTHVESNDDVTFYPPEAEYDGKLYDGVVKRKFGIEATYSLLSWFAVSARADAVYPDVDFEASSFSQISPRLLFRSGWNARDQVALQYSHFFYNNWTAVRGGFPLDYDVTIVPDTDMFALTASMWW
jgi:hypothetical protein